MWVATAAFLRFLLAHGDLIEALYDALEAATDPEAKKAELLKAIRDGQIAATDAAVAADLGPRT